MSMVAPIFQAENAVGWYGKIPAAGDFVMRQLPYPLLRAWERWMQSGLNALRQQGAQMLSQHYAVAPAWNFLLPAGLGCDAVQLGCLAPSHDRVGRHYPVAAILGVPPAEFDNALLEGAAPFYRQVGEAILGAVRQELSVEQLSDRLAAVPGDWRGRPPRGGAGDILAVLEPGAGDQGLAWPELSLSFDARGATGFWWTHQGDGAPLQTHTHNGEPDDALFVRLFGPQRGDVS